jgi:threonylcarbamoyladenosine tRNA methylthiotransferase MtaB
MKVSRNSKDKRIKLDTLGCKLNQAETEILAGQFVQSGYRLVSSLDEADIYVLNTCTVTHIADRKSRHLLRMAHRCNAEAVVVAIGCYAQRSRQELADINGVNMVLDNGEKMNLLQLLKANGFLSVSNCSKGDLQQEHKNGMRSRAFVKVQDGCDNLCTYCTVPFVRKVKKCLPPKEIVGQVDKCTTAGYKEVVLTGTEIGDYECDDYNLKELIERILGETKIERLRLSSLQPQHISRALTSLWRNHRLCRHFHLALQSGSDTVLRRMKRRYTNSDYEKAVKMIREILLDVAITTDIIVGFPGETDREFEDSYQFCKRMGFARIHVFPYSRRSQTAAAEMPQQVNDKIIRLRRDKMLKVSEQSSKTFRERFSGKKVSVLWEQQKNGYWNGLTSNYTKVYTESNKNLANKITVVTLGEIWREGMKASPSPLLEGIPLILSGHPSKHSATHL